ncbi:putative leucine-rich repeat domain superfamily [Helianthus annuus]|nr:putative leucine-rich repeat domain superfamily [Helianthus annuus]
MLVESPKLKSLVFIGSKLSKLDLALTPQLETLDLQGCNDLVELNMPVECPKLKSLVLNGYKLSNHDLEELHMPVTMLKYVVLNGYKLINHDLQESHMPFTKLKSLYLGITPQLVTLDLKGCNDLV